MTECEKGGRRAREAYTSCVYWYEKRGRTTMHSGLLRDLHKQYPVMDQLQAHMARTSRWWQQKSEYTASTQAHGMV